MRKRFIHQAIGVLAAASTATPALAQQTRGTVDAILSGGYASSPFLSGGGGGTGDGGGGPYVEGVIAPNLSQVDERGSVVFNGVGRVAQYFNDFGLSWSIVGSADVARRLNTRTAVRASGSVMSQVVGERGAIGLAGNAPIDVPGTPVADRSITAPTPVIVDPLIPSSPLIPDLTIFGSNRRQTMLSAGAGVTHQLTELETVNLDVNLQRSSVEGGAFFNFETYSGTIGYQRGLSETTSLGGRVIYQRSRFGLGGDSDIYQPQLTLNARIDALWAVNAAVGLLVARTRSAFGRDDITGFSANVQACRAGERSSLCLTGLSDATPTGIGTISRRVSIAGTYQQQLSEDDALTFAADYIRVEERQQLAGRGDFAFLSSAATFDHRFSRWVTVGLALRYRDTIGDIFGQPTDKAVSAFVRTNLGRNR